MSLFKTLFVLFFLLFIGSVTLLILVLLPLFISEARYRLDQVNLGQGALRSWLMPQFNIKMPEPKLDQGFSIWIEKIKISSQVFANIDASNPKAYKPILMKGVAHAAGTAFPGQGQGNIYLFAHSTDTTINIARYNAVFFLLRYVEKGDKVVIYYLGKKYTYQVFDKLMTDANDVRYLSRGDGAEQLVLQTCWPPGTTWKRLLILAKPV
ncbi:hypothetical protein A2160_04040 [Candidatus Beckwithbacteria bacterium RBG_13_42_9]|uniref:Sortase n=1 Tax=Candidatus Beckwithbacteria bacterium RBG_13_42_9 TaxID=1797457 RepID=A0A1F5E308_9BACT|nr:MAG: hypothetical protein A2160_04040 [Candidatus Beckwithbacteria bacterium RBG_13_42_9]